MSLKLQQKIDLAKATALVNLERHILEECERWDDWHDLSPKQKEEVISGYESCFFAGFNAAQKLFLGVARIPEEVGE